MRCCAIYQVGLSSLNLSEQADEAELSSFIVVKAGDERGMVKAIDVQPEHGSVARVLRNFWLRVTWEFTHLTSRSVDFFLSFRDMHSQPP